MSSRTPTAEEIELWRAEVANGGLRFLPLPSHRVVPFAAVLDLHGRTVNDAYRATREFVGEARARGQRVITIITGRSGQIRQEIERWLAPLESIITIKETDRGGAFRVRLRTK